MQSSTLRAMIAPFLADAGFQSYDAPQGRTDDPLGGALARLAREKGAAVGSLHRLARELEAFGGPKPLVHGARRAALDTIRHARMVGAMARRYGKPADTQDERDGAATRSWDAMAVENAIDGCVRRAWDLALVSFAGVHATDPYVRETMRRIARDQGEHVALAWRVHAWCLPRASAQARERICRAMRATVSALDAEIERGEDDELVRWGVRPSRETARALLEKFRERLWRNALEGPATR